MNHSVGKEANTKIKRASYETPTIIYKGKISTRAGSPFSADTSKSKTVDPADLFDN
ncbi:MAG: hypothetical protein GY796_29380 [Chloroflexi bacterium]|nr:hypothetical protein [Chloroflexota bacterium]